MLRHSTPSLSGALFGALLVLLPVAASAAPEKAGYTLFQRTPASLLRDLSTDRPDLTESPYTVDAGWWQLESDLAAYTRDHDKSRGADVKASALSFATFNLKAGLTHRIDLQTVIETYTRVRVHDHASGRRERASGFGDITSRLKINLWGNDGGQTAFALMPFIKWPTSRHGLGNDSIEGGLIAPFALELPGGWSCGMMTEVDIVRNESDTGYTAEWVNTITFSRDIAGRLGGYVELATALVRGRDLATFDCGLTYGVSRDIQLDCGANLGLTPATEDLTLFAGLTVRF